MNPRHRLVFALLSLLVVAACYLITVNGPFIYDDIGQIYNNTKLHDVWSIHDVIFCGSRESRLLSNLFFAACWTLAPGQSWPFHVFYILCHLANGLLVFRLLARAWKAPADLSAPVGVWIATALFLLHPLQAQGVSYIMGGVSCVQCFLFLISLEIHLSELRARDFINAAVLGASILTKESGVLIPAMLLLWDLTIAGRSLKTIAWRRYGAICCGFLVLVPLYAVVVNPLHAQVFGKATGFSIYPYGHYLMTESAYYLLHLVLLFDPSRQSLIHEYPDWNASVLIASLLSLGLITAAVSYAAAKRKTSPGVTFLVGFYFLILLPTNTFVEMVNPFAEYRLYQPNIALFAAMGFGLEWVLGLIGSAVLRAGVLLAFGLCLIAGCVMEQRVWADPAMLLTQSLSVYPNSPELVQILGGYFEDAGRFDLAEQLYSRSEELLGKHPRVLLTHPSTLLVILYLRAGKSELALRELEKIRSNPSFGPVPAQYLETERRLRESLGRP